MSLTFRQPLIPRDDLFEVDETLVVTSLTDMTRPTTASSPFSSSPSSTAPSMHQIPTGLSGIANNFPGALGSTETLTKGPSPFQPCDVYVSDVDAGPAHYTPNVHIMPRSMSHSGTPNPPLTGETGRRKDHVE